MGRLRDGFSARVADAHDAELPPGEAGELLLRADEPFAFATGYWGMPDRTVEAWRNLWFHTGDRVVRDAEGRFRFVDRLKDAIRRRGENVSSYEVEQVLLSHPSIAAAAVFPVGSELAEDEVMAAVVPEAGAVLDPVELVRFCETRMPHFAVPRYVDLVDDLPRTENGKVRKVALRERGVGPSTWDREAAGVTPLRTRRSPDNDGRLAVPPGGTLPYGLRTGLPSGRPKAHTAWHGRGGSSSPEALLRAPCGPRPRTPQARLQGFAAGCVDGGPYASSVNAYSPLQTGQTRERNRNDERRMRP
ncbi:MAG: Long-chain-fatty-acid--CoA ligase [Actinobacteria bacterium ADurb.BinA094]|nr:MAG: Long-chain-fatty-acid--CoA ligase [Actinobacteria bacterium ADurb.BinA094]